MIQYTGSNIDFIPNKEIVARKNGSSYSYEQNLTAHLGNVRLNFNENPTTHALAVIQKDDYFAFGKRSVVLAGLNKYLYNGKKITRKVKGIPDELGYFSPTQNSTVNYFMNLPNVGALPNSDNQKARHDAINDAKYGRRDYMPDEYYYSVLGTSGRFMFSQRDSKFILFPKEDVDVQKSITSSGLLQSWQLKLPAGIFVDFGKDACIGQQTNIGNLERTIYNAWQIKSIKNNYNDSITYTYKQSTYQQYKIGGEQVKLHSAAGGIENNISVSNLITYDSKIDKVSFPGGEVQFITLPREDMPGNALSEIRIYNLNKKLIKQVQFSYTYFYGNAFDILPTINGVVAGYVSDNYRNKRLKLNSITINNGNSEPVSYLFDYYSADQIPSKYSFSQDHWGFYNAALNISAFSFIPSLDKSFQGGDRRVNPITSKVFSLKSVVYPEGGKREFIYENNTASISDVPSDLLATYQDENFVEKSSVISISSYSRTTHHPDPDETINGVRFFRKQFTITTGTAYPIFGNGWSISTNFGISDLEKNTPYFADNVNFSLERINADNSRTIVKSFNTTDPNYINSGSKPRNGTDQAILNIGPGKYEMIVKIVYANQANSAADNQPYNLGFTVKWREMDETKNMIYVGGLRIRDINYYDNTNRLVKSRFYAYSKPNTNSTSGRILSLPQYYQPRMKHYKDANGIDRIDWIGNFTSTSILPLETTSGSSTGYEYVDEYDVDVNVPQNRIRTAYQFSFDRGYFATYYSKKYAGLIDSKEWNRGMLLNKKYYNGEDLVRMEDFKYFGWSPHLANSTDEDFVEEINTDFISFQSLQTSCECVDPIYPDDFYDVTDGGLNNCVYFYYTPFDNHVQSNAGQPILSFGPNPPISTTTCDWYETVPYFKHYTGFNKLESKTITVFDKTSKKVIENENFKFERTPIHYQITTVGHIGSSGTYLYDKFKYPQDTVYTGLAESGRLKLIANHQINTVLSEHDYQNGSFTVKSTEYNVDPSTNLVVPALTKTKISNGSEEVRDVFYKYDKKGNILSLSKFNGPKTNFLWSYNGQYPVAKIVNANYSDIEAILGKSQIERFSNAFSLSKYSLDSLIAPLKTLLPDGMIYTYTYGPLVGMTSETDSKGMSTYYEYDDLQRLKAIKDYNGNLVKSFNYNYGSSTLSYKNDQRTGNFVKNDCPQGQIGSSVTYVVPKDKYSANSKAEANELADSEITANGQTYANSHGGCSIPTTAMVNINYTNSDLIYGCNVKFKDITTGREFNYVIPYGSGTLGPIPEGSYDVSMYFPNGNSTEYMFKVGGAFSTGAEGFYGQMYFNATSNNISISNQQ